jgi:hypothetical protein
MLQDIGSNIATPRNDEVNEKKIGILIHKKFNKSSYTLIQHSLNLMMMEVK